MYSDNFSNENFSNENFDGDYYDDSYDNGFNHSHGFDDQVLTYLHRHFLFINI